MRVDSVITLGKGELSRRDMEKLLRALTFYDAEENEISAYQYLPGKDQLILPRGALDLLPRGLEVEDMRSRPLMPKLAYAKQLDALGYEGQSAAVKEMFLAQQGQVIAPPGRGKTEIALAFAAACRTRVLVVVHTQDLYQQWIDRAADSVPGMSVGKIQGSNCQVEHLTIAMAQTLRQYIGNGGKFWRQFGAVIVDETHHAAAETWEWILNVCPAYYRFGITASEKRSDGRQPLVRFNVGPVIYRLKFRSAVPMTVIPIKTGFTSKWNGLQWTRIVHDLVRNESRNQRIAEIVNREVREGNTVLVLSRQIKHLELIRDILVTDPEMEGHIKVVTGKIPRGRRDGFIQQLRNGDIRCILGTQLFEEGIDIPRLNRIVLAFPGTEVTALQKVGRGARKHEGKTETIVYDMLDDLVRVLVKQYLRRRTWYKSVGIQVGKVVDYGQDEATAVRRAKSAQGRKRDRIFRPARSRR